MDHNSETKASQPSQKAPAHVTSETSTQPKHNQRPFQTPKSIYEYAVWLAPVVALILALSSQDQGVISLFRQNEQVQMSLAGGSVASNPPICENNYSIEILSINPVVFYINNFINDEEIKHILAKYTPTLQHSLVYLPDFESVVDTRYRTSQSATIPPSDSVSKCLQSRMNSLLGNLQHLNNEPLQLVKYEAGGKFNIHFDWFQQLNNDTHFEDAIQKPYNRLGSIFVYLADGCTGGETYFPNIKGVSAKSDGEKFARTESGQGLLVKPKRGNAVFWNNLHMNGTGDTRLAHAGMPVHSGVKIGLNMFSFYYPDTAIIGD